MELRRRIRELRRRVGRRWKVVTQTDWENQLRATTELAECRHELEKALEWARGMAKREALARRDLEATARANDRLQKQVEQLCERNATLLKVTKQFANLERTADWYADKMEQNAHIKAWFVHKDHPLKRSVFHVLWNLLNEQVAVMLDAKTAGTAAAVHASGGADALKNARDIMGKYYVTAHARADEYTEQERREMKRHGY